MQKLKHARLVLLARDDLLISILTEKTDKEAAMIWVKVGTQKENSILIGGIYRQHKLLSTEHRDVTRQQLLLEQERRWEKIIRKWKTISRNVNCVVIGDLNLDHLRWSSPEQHLERMVDQVKDNIETCGFLQLITGHTRVWQQQADSLLDHVWSNCPARILRTWNDTRGSSDHNVIGVEVVCKDVRQGGDNIVKRVWKKFDKTSCLTDFKNTSWQDVLEETNVNVANALMEEKICRIMDKHAPFQTVQVRSNYKKWISDKTKVEMNLRDTARERARATNLDCHWEEYRSRRNSCTQLQRQDKKKHLNDLFENIEKEADTAKLFSTTRELLGWKRSGPPKCFDMDGRLVRKQKELADCQASFYEQKVQKIKMKIPQVNVDPLKFFKRNFKRWIPDGGMPKFTLKSVTEKEVGCNDIKTQEQSRLRDRQN